MTLLSLCRWIETAPSIKIILLSSISPEWELGCWGSYLLPYCGEIVPTRAVGHILHSVNSRCQLHLLNTVGNRKIELWVQFVPLCNALRLKRTFFSRQLSLSGKEPLLTGRLWHDSVCCCCHEYPPQNASAAKGQNAETNQPALVWGRCVSHLSLNETLQGIMAMIIRKTPSIVPRWENQEDKTLRPSSKQGMGA